MFVLRALHSFVATLGDRKPNKRVISSPSLRRLPVTMEGCKGVQRLKEQTLLLLLSIEDVE